MARSLLSALALVALLAGCNRDDSDCARRQAEASAKRMEATVYEEARASALQLARRMEEYAYSANAQADDLQRKANEICARPVN